MSDGRRARRTVRGLAGLFLGLAVSASGCSQLPIPRPNGTPIPTAPPGRPAAVAPGQPNAPASAPDERELLPPLPPRAAATDETPEPDRPTPLIDEALARASALQEVDATSLEDEEDRTSEGPPSEPADLLPPATPESRQPEPSPRPDALSAVARIKVIPAPESHPIDPEKPVEPVKPADLWREGLERLRNLAREQAGAAGTRPSVWSSRARLLDDLQRVDPEADSANLPLWRTIVAALGASGDPSAPAGRTRSSEIRAAVRALEDVEPLEIADLRLCRKVNGYGNFEPIDATACKAGQPLIVYCEMAGVRYSTSAEVFYSRLSSRVELVPASGGEPVWSQGLGTAEDRCRRRRRDYYVNYRIVLPESVAPGSYELRLTQVDEIARRTTYSALALTIQP